ncbi:MAG: ACT domain-containing protein [Lachnospiraceae bacterium]|nr:ACT domain-containing protein [Lachnospiraceae bacterium]
MRAIVTVIGKDRVGIIHQVTGILAEHQVNVLDISQTIMQEYFTMIMLVDTALCEISFSALSELLDRTGKEMSLSIRIQREDSFEAMHRI